MNIEQRKRWRRLITCITTAFLLLVMSGNVFAASSDELVYGSNGTITRGEWLHDLVVLFNMTVEEENYPDEYFEDVTSGSGYVYYDDLMKATEFGVIDIEAGEAVRPDDPATRAFAAHTLNYCLAIEPDPGYTFSDAASVPYPQDAEVAVDRKWFALTAADEFAPDTSVTEDEVRVMVADVQAIQAQTEIEENYDNTYQFAEGVIVVPEDVDVALEAEPTSEADGTVSLSNLPADSSIDIESGNTFAVYLNGVPRTFEARTVTEEETEDGPQLVITVKDADLDTTITDMDAQGVVEADLVSAQPLDGSTITYIEGGTPAAAFEDGIEHISARIADSKDIRAINISREIQITTGIKLKLDCKLFNLRIDYRVQAKDMEVYVACSGDAIVTSNLKADVLAALGARKSIPLTVVPVGGIGSISVTLQVGLDGEMTLTYSTGFTAGMQYSNSMGFRLVKNFTKSNYTLETQVNMKLGVRAEAALKIPIISGSIYAEVGAKGEVYSKNYGDEKLPDECTTFRGWMYAQAGASLTVAFGPIKKTFPARSSDDIYNFSNSPVRVVYHWEDGKLVSQCTRGASAAGDAYTKYLTHGWKFGSSGNGSYLNANGEIEGVYTYNKIKDENNLDAAEITGYTGSVHTLTIPKEIDGLKVIKIQDKAFKDRAEITMVIIPDTVTEIGNSAFAGCTNLRQVNLSKGLKTLGQSAFADCINLTGIEIPKSLETANGYSYSSNYAWGPFDGCSALNEVTFEAGTERVAPYLFSGCTGLTGIEIPDTVTLIGEGAFSQCVNLTELTVPGHVTTIERGAFCGCTALNSADIGTGVSNIGQDAFSGCTGLKTVTMGNAVASIGNSAFAGCSNLTQVTLSKGLKTLGQSAFADCINLTAIEIPKSLETANGYSYSSNYAWGPFDGCSALNEVAFEAGTERVAPYLFSGCTGLTGIEIPDTVTLIGEGAFSQCVNLTELTVPGHVTTIERGAFCGCTALDSADIGTGVSNIGQDAFSGCTGLKTVTMGNAVASIGNSAFAGCSNLTQVTLSKRLKTLGQSVFADCINLTGIEIPKSLETANGYSYFSNYAWGPFDGCSALNDVTFEAGTQRIAPYLFSGCTGLTGIEIPDTVTLIGEGAFSQCENLKSITVPDHVTTIERGAFCGCTALDSADIGAEVRSIGQRAFSDCTGLKTVNLPDGVTELPNNVFYGCASLPQITIPETVTRIGENAFENAGLTSLVIPAAVTSIDDSAFKGNAALEQLTVSDSAVTIGNAVFMNCTALATVDLGKAVKSLGNEVFRNCDALTAIAVPDMVTSIGTYCFADSGTLADVTLGTGITLIPQGMFDQCQALVSIVLPYRITEIKASAFTNCTSLTTITIPRATTKIAAGVFSYPGSMTIRGVSGTYAETYANENNITFVPIDVPAESVTLSETELTINRNDSRTLALTVEPADFTDEVTWASSAPTVVTVDSSGKITAKAVGEADVKVYVGGKEAACHVTVVQPVTSLRLSKTRLELEAFGSEQLTVTVNPSEAYNKDVLWSSSDETVATVDQTGLVKAVSKGTADIKVEALDGSNRTAVCEVTVKNNGYRVSSWEQLESPHPYENNCVDYWEYTDEEADEMLQVTFDAQTELEDGFDFLYIYSEDGTQVGKYTGKELAGQTVKVPGDTVRIKLETNAGGTRWGFKVVNVFASASRQDQQLTGAESYEKVYGDLPFALDIEHIVGDGALTYTSDNEGVATVDADGNVTITGVGVAHITAAAAATEDFNSAEKTVTVTVAKGQQNLNLQYSKDALRVGQSLRIQAESATGSLSYTTDNAAVAAVNEKGVVTGMAQGTANITVRSEGNENYEPAEEVVPLTVTAAEEADVSLEDCTIALADAGVKYVYNEEAKTPKVILSYEGETLTEGTDYEVYYENNVNVGTAIVHAFALAGSNYTGETQITFEIIAAELEDGTIVSSGAFQGSDLKSAELKDTVTEIGDRAFADCADLKDVYFQGSAPKMGENVFENVEATVRYPADDATWTQDKLQDYGGSLTWVPWNYETGQAAKRSLSAFGHLEVAAENCIYDGTAKTPAVTVTDGGFRLTENVDYTVSYDSNINAGSGKVTAAGCGSYEGTLSMGFTIGKADPVLGFATGSLSKTYGDPAFRNALQTAVTDGVVTYSSGNVAVAAVAADGTVTLNGAGTAVITAAAAPGANYNGGSASYTLTVAKRTNAISAENITRTYSKKKQTLYIGASALDGAALTYASGNKSVQVDGSGRITIAKKFMGTASIRIQAADTVNYTAASAVITVTVNPKGTSLRKIKNSTSKKALVTWKKNKDVKGYEIQYSTNANFGSGTKTKRISKKATTKCTLTKLKKGKTYFVRIRTWAKAGGVKCYSAWSKAKKVKIKK